MAVYAGFCNTVLLSSHQHKWRPVASAHEQNQVEINSNSAANMSLKATANPNTDYVVL